MTSFTTQAGQLKVNVHQVRHPIHEMLTFASRQNPKRGFMLVSKVLGRYVPSTPAQMRATYDEIASLVGAGQHSFVVSMAEAATGFGAGVADSLYRLQSSPVYFQHTTRHLMHRPLWLQLDEAHSHAVDHMLYEPVADCLFGIRSSKRLVLVDDEITTGRTLRLLAERLLPKLPLIEEIVIASLVCMLDEETRKPFEALPVPVRFVSLLDASLSFSPNPQYAPELPNTVDSDPCDLPSSADYGRCGLRMPFTGELPILNGDHDLTVVANGEHQFIPFLVAEREAKRGRNVLFQHINRSPLLIGDVITRKHTFAVDKRPVKHYLYNLADTNRQVIVMLEDEKQRADHELACKYPLYLRIEAHADAV